MTNKELLPCVEVETNDNPIISVIWLHGLGADGHDFESIVPMLNLPETLPIRFIFPHAPIRPVTINFGAEMRAWYDIVAIDPRAPEDAKGIINSEEQVSDLIENEHQRGIAYDKIILAGFSQGGAIALHTGLRYTKKIAGIIALSAYLPLANQWAKENSKANQNTPIFMAHGIADPIVPFAFGEHAKKRLAQEGYHIDWHKYPIEHTTCFEEIQDISTWIQHIF